MKWADLKKGDVFHWRDGSDDGSYLVLDIKRMPHCWSRVSMFLLELDTGLTHFDERPAERQLPSVVHLVDRSLRGEDEQVDR